MVSKHSVQADPCLKQLPGVDKSVLFVYQVVSAGFPSAQCQFRKVSVKDI